MQNAIYIRRANVDDHEKIAQILSPVFDAGETYAFPPGSSQDEIIAYWFSVGKKVYVAMSGGETVGTYFIQSNQPGLGSHVANAGYVVSKGCSGRGIGKIMAEHSLEEARQLGYKAMQFNLVVKSNEGAIALWKKMGFQVIGEIPGGFNHRQLGLINAYIMFRSL